MSRAAASLCLCALAAGAAMGAPRLGIDEILAKNAEARGGLAAWRNVQTMIWSGHVQRAAGGGPSLPFVYEQKRPNRTRFEIVGNEQASVRVFDGRQGWKMRASPGGRPDLQAYSEEERRAASDALIIDGPVLDARAKGVVVTLDGIDQEDGREAYRLQATLPSGTVERVWIDAETFLDVRYDRPARDAAGRPTTVAVHLRNYTTQQGLRIPLVIETGAPGGGESVDRLVIDRVTINPSLPDGRFARPGLRTSRRGITVDTRVPGQPPGPRRP